MTIRYIVLFLLGFVSICITKKIRNKTERNAKEIAIEIMVAVLVMLLADGLWALMK